MTPRQKELAQARLAEGQAASVSNDPAHSLFDSAENESKIVSQQTCTFISRRLTRAA